MSIKTECKSNMWQVWNCMPLSTGYGNKQMPHGKTAVCRKPTCSVHEWSITQTIEKQGPLLARMKRTGTQHLF